MKKLKKDNKGFTLVELIVVIVILAILAAILVPALLGYIDKAKQQQAVLNAKSALTAAQAEMSTLYAKGEAASKVETDPYKSDITTTADVPKCTKLVIGCDADDSSTTDHKAYTVTYVEYQETGMAKPIIYDGKSWDTSNTKPSTVKATYTIK